MSARLESDYTCIFIVFIIYKSPQMYRTIYKTLKRTRTLSHQVLGLAKKIYMYAYVHIYTQLTINCFRNHWWWLYWAPTYQVLTRCQALSEVLHKLLILISWGKYSQQLHREMTELALEDGMACPIPHHGSETEVRLESRLWPTLKPVFSTSATRPSVRLCWVRPPQPTKVSVTCQYSEFTAKGW